MRFALNQTKMEVQRHGFTWERDILTNVYRATEAELAALGYTDSVDLPACLNRLDGVAVSVKTSCSVNTVCMGDALRIYDKTSDGAEPIHLVVIHYEQEEGRKVLKTIIELRLTAAHQLLFGSVTREEIVKLVALIKAVPKRRRPTDEEKVAIALEVKRLSAASGAIRFNPKIDSKSQRRLQCSFNHFQDFLQRYPDRVISKADGATFRGGVIQPSIVSGRRVFNA